jgi:hypothetical protein
MRMSRGLRQSEDSAALSRSCLMDSRHSEDPEGNRIFIVLNFALFVVKTIFLVAARITPATALAF